MANFQQTSFLLFMFLQVGKEKVYNLFINKLYNNELRIIIRYTCIYVCCRELYNEPYLLRVYHFRGSFFQLPEGVFRSHLPQ